MVDDFNAIVSHMCIHLYKMAHAAIRRTDKNHLILGSFIKEWGLRASLKRRYFDLIAPQHWNEEINTQVYKHSPYPTIPKVSPNWTNI